MERQSHDLYTARSVARRDSTLTRKGIVMEKSAEGTEKNKTQLLYGLVRLITSIL